ncbi:MAG: hypothetical protein Q7T56_09090 [Nocardioidaceae bacterium]|nr:hypothetical protein [Nocardioidaceae bacterium]
MSTDVHATPAAPHTAAPGTREMVWENEGGHLLGGQGVPASQPPVGPSFRDQLSHKEHDVDDDAWAGPP